MQILLHYDGPQASRWMNEFIIKKVKKLDRFLNPSAKVEVFIKNENILCCTTIAIHNPKHNYSFSADGENVYESFSMAVDKATTSLSENKRKFKDRIHRRAYAA